MARGLPSADLIAAIYQAAVDDARWPDFAMLVGRAARIQHTGVWITENEEVIDISLAEIWRSLGAAYKERFAGMDPWANSLARAPLERVMLGYEHLREDELVKTEFFNEFAQPGGMFRPMGVRMQLSPGVYSTIGSDLPWSRLRFEQSDKPRLRRIIPYVKHALQLRLRWRDSQIHTRTGAAILDALAFAVIVCDQNGRVGYANAAAEALDRSGTTISFGRRGAGLLTRIPAEADLLRRLICETGAGGAGGSMRIGDADGKTLLLALVTPLPAGLAGDDAPGHVLISLRSAKDSGSFTTAILGSLFGLSPTQAEIALGIFDGKSPEQIAVERRIAISTLRTHLAEIFARTGVENQRDLVRLFGRLPPVLARSGDRA